MAEQGAGLSTARDALVAAARRLDAAGLNTNSSGNLGVRVAEGVVVTPSGIPAASLQPADMVLVDTDGVVVDGERTPTSEWRIHVELLARRPEVGAVVHTHSPEATAASAIGTSVPAVHYVVARFGAPVLPCARYATYGTAALAHSVLQTLGPHGTACLMANHGAVALGRDLETAMALALDVEWFCGVHRRAVQLGTPMVLPPDELEVVASRFAGYGQPGAQDQLSEGRQGGEAGRSEGRGPVSGQG